MANQGWFDKILAATDGSASSVVAEELAAFVAKKFKAKVTVIHDINARESEVSEEITASLKQRATAIVADP